MVFYHWWTTTVLFWVGTAVAYYFGFVNWLFETDITYLTFIIFGLFNVMNVWAGLVAWKVKQGKKFPEHSYGPLWFSSDAFISLGMIGTLIGFLLVLTTAFGSVDSADVDQVKMVISELASGMGVALTTTLVGLVCSLTMKYQLVAIEQENEKLQK